MKPSKFKTFVCNQPAAIVNNASLTTNVIDTRGFNFAEIFVFLGATDIALTAVKVQEADAASDATTLTGGADVPGAVFGTSVNDAGTTSALPTATDDNKVYKFEIDLRGRKRYLKPVVTIGSGATGAFVVTVANLHEADNVPTSAADKGCAQVLRVPVIS